MEPLIGIEPMTSSFVYTSPCGRTRLYLSPDWRPLSVVRAPSATVLSILWTLTVIRDSYPHYCGMGRGLRPTNDVLYQLSYNGINYGRPKNSLFIRYFQSFVKLAFSALHYLGIKSVLHILIYLYKFLFLSP